MTSRFEKVSTPLAGLVALKRKPVGDQRGSLDRLFCEDDLAELLSGRHVHQANQTLTRLKGTVRGMHFQMPPHAECKIISCLQGRVFDVAVDLRRGSATFLHWHGEILDACEDTSLFIPEGFAHGFQALEDECRMLYFHTASYRPGSESGIRADDPALDIRWPLALANLSSRDMAHPTLDASFPGLAP